MRRQPMLRDVRRKPFSERRFSRIAGVVTLPPPVGGWNRRDALSNMPQTDAVDLRNWFPRQSDVITRPGYAEHCDTGETTEVQQLISYEYQTSNKLLACVNGKIFDVTTDTPSSLATGLTANYWSYDYLSGVVLMANGADVVKSYNGTAIANPAYTGVTLSNLEHVSVYKSRAYFTQKNTQSMWYGATGAIAGALTEFDFSGVSGLEGNLLFTSHLKGDGGDGGADDVFVAVFAGGDVLAYSGSNPSDPTDWQLIGHYRIGRPLSRMAYVRADDDVYVITDRGYEQLSRMTKFGDSFRRQDLVSYKIQEEVTLRISEIGASNDWRVHVYPKGQMLMFVVPRNADARATHVRNMNTGAWCYFDGFRPHSWASLQGVSYFGNQSGIVHKFDEGATNDNGTTIRCDAQSAWTNLGRPGITKHMQLVKPFLFGAAAPSLSVNFNSDYDTITLASFTSQGTSSGAVWDTAVWDTAIWSGGDSTFADWYSRNAIGEAIGMRLAVDVDNFRVRWNQTTVTFTTGSYL